MNDPEFSKKRQFFKQFIRLYESFPCLWNQKSFQYRDRELRAKAYKALVKKMQEFQPGADRMAVVRKINCLRTNLRKEKRKILEGAKAGRVIKPRLWYHHHFDFLNGIGRTAEVEAAEAQSVEKNKTENMNSVRQFKIEDTSSDSLEPVYEITFESNQNGNLSQEEATEKTCQLTYEMEPVQMHSTNSMTGSIHKSNIEENRKQDQDRHEVFGKNVAMKLRHISSKNDTQRIMAEKIINEALSLAEMGLLTLESSKVLK